MALCVTQTIATRAGTMQAQAPLLLSASRRTDIPAFYTDWFLARLAKGWCACPNPFTRRLSLISFARTRFIVFWSKNPRPLLAALPHLQRRGLHCLVQYTLNDYEQEGFEHVPALPTRLETFRLLSQALGRKALIWRFDPLLLTDRLNEDMLLARIARLADSLGPYTEQLVFSFADIAGCRKARNNLQRSHIAWQEWTKTRMEDFAGRLSLMKHRHGWPFSLATCCEEIELGQFGIAHARCIDADRIVQLGLEDRELLQGMGVQLQTRAPLLPGLVSGGSLPEGAVELADGRYFVSVHRKDKGQRPHCGCMEAKDIGQYDTCPHLCAYCYANSAPSVVAGNWQKHTQAPLAATLSGDEPLP